MNIIKKILGACCMLFACLLLLAASMALIKCLSQINIAAGDSTYIISSAVGNFIGFAILIGLGILLFVFGARQFRRRPSVDQPES